MWCKSDKNSHSIGFILYIVRFIDKNEIYLLLNKVKIISSAETLEIQGRNLLCKNILKGVVVGWTTFRLTLYEHPVFFIPNTLSFSLASGVRNEKVRRNVNFPISLIFTFLFFDFFFFKRYNTDAIHAYTTIKTASFSTMIIDKCLFILLCICI